MTSNLTIGQRRLLSQRIASITTDQPGDSVSWMGLVQAQDYLGALWAVGVRTEGATESTVEGALADRRIVRTWLARGTLHITSAADIRWLLNLLAPRILANLAGRYRRLDLDTATFDRSRRLISDLLKGGIQQSRKSLLAALEAEHISTAGQRGVHILMRLALEGLICFGAREGKQHTFVLLDEWLPQSRDLPHDQALSELARRYVAGHGPATVQDFAWWSGLKVSEARAALDLSAPFSKEQRFNGHTYWQAAERPLQRKPLEGAYLLPPFDEYLVGYTDRSDVLDPQYAKQLNAGGGILHPAILIDGQVLGIWKRLLGKRQVMVIPNWFAAPTPAHKHAFHQAAQRYGTFLGFPVSFVDEKFESEGDTMKIDEYDDTDPMNN